MKCLPGFGHKFPIIAFGMERKLQNAEGVRIANFACWQRCGERAMVLATRAGNEFSNALGGVGFPFGILRREAFVIVVVSVDDDGSPRFVQVLPECFHLGIVAVLRAGTK